jgi:hypothetical protein
MGGFWKMVKFWHLPHSQEAGKGKGKTQKHGHSKLLREIIGTVAILAQSYQQPLTCKTLGDRNRVVGGALTAVQAICSDCYWETF